MTAKYHPRHSSAFSRDDQAFERKEAATPEWYSSFLTNLEKQSVKSKREDYSLFDQINQMMGNPKSSKYSTVDEAVSDLRERTGLNAFLKSAQNQTNNEDPKQSTETKSLFDQTPGLKNFIDNYVDTHPGTSMEAVLHDLLKIKAIKNNLPESDDVPEDVKRYISEKIDQKHGELNTNTSEEIHIGEQDLSYDQNNNKDNDPFAVCMPKRD